MSTENLKEMQERIEKLEKIIKIIVDKNVNTNIIINSATVYAYNDSDFLLIGDQLKEDEFELLKCFLCGENYKDIELLIRDYNSLYSSYEHELTNTYKENEASKFKKEAEDLLKTILEKYKTETIDNGDSYSLNFGKNFLGDDIVYYIKKI